MLQPSSAQVSSESTLNSWGGGERDCKLASINDHKNVASFIMELRMKLSPRINLEWKYQAWGEKNGDSHPIKSRKKLT